MLGMVFTEFVDLVEQRFGIELLDRVIQDADLGHEAAYTAVGYYPFGELQKLLGSLAALTGAPPADLLRVFGRHLFQRLREGHPQFFEEPGFDLFQLLLRVDSVVHTEVRKLYANARLPHFTCAQVGPDALVLRYASDRGLADLAHGLIEGAAEYFGESVSIRREPAGERDGVAGIDFHIGRIRH